MNKKEKQKILYPDYSNGIYKYEYVKINGIKQYIQIRGKDKKNPLILFVHGGPGGSTAGMAHILMGSWEEKFTVVNWDQRNTCKTLLANKDRVNEIGKSGTMSDYIKDIDEIIWYLHTVYEFDKIILMGFSWGTVISSEYSKLHPENVSVYIGVGQLINYVEGFQVVCEQLMERAKAAGNKKDIMKIEKIIEHIPKNAEASVEWLKQIRQFSVLGMKYISKSTKIYSAKDFYNSPLLDRASRKTWFKQDPKMHEGSFKTMFNYDFRDNMTFPVPAIFITGEEDTACPHSFLKGLIDSIEAPRKELHIVDKAGHNCYYDNAEEFLRILINVTS